MCAHQTAQWPTIRVIEWVHGVIALIIYLSLAVQIFVKNIRVLTFTTYSDTVSVWDLEITQKLRWELLRKPVPQPTQDNVMVRSRRRCCICYGLDRDLSIKNGQIAHLDRRSENPLENNLAFLCLEHHNIYDSTTKQSKNFTPGEVKRYREELYKDMEIYVSLPPIWARIWAYLMRKKNGRLS